MKREGITIDTTPFIGGDYFEPEQTEKLVPEFQRAVFKDAKIQRRRREQRRLGYWRWLAVSILQKMHERSRVWVYKLDPEAKKRGW